MAAQIFVNLPVKDLDKTVDFFTKLGYTFNQQFTNESATCMIVEENIFVMLLVEKFFKTFITTTEMADAKKTTEVLIALTANSRAGVDEMISKAVEAGGTIYREAQDHGFMYTQCFQDLDGHIWEIFWMDPAHISPS